MDGLIVESDFLSNSLSGQSGNAFKIEGQQNQWGMFRFDVQNTGNSGYVLLPSAWGAVTGFIAAHPEYTTQALDILWIYNASTPIKSTPAVAGNVLYIASNGTLYAIKETTGEMMWKYNTFNTYPATMTEVGNILIHSSPAVSSGAVYFGSGDTLYAIYINGTQKWNYTTGGYVLSSPIAYGGVVYFGSTDGHLYSIYENGTHKWNYSINEKIVSTPTISGSNVIIKGWNGTVASIFSNGTLMWNVTKPLGGWSSPVIYGTDVVFGTANATGNSTLYSYFNNGTLHWEAIQLTPISP